MNLNIRIVHDQIFRQEVLHRRSINNIKLRVTFETIYKVLHSIFKLIPVSLVLLDFGLCTTEVFVELLQVIVIVNFVKFFLLCDFFKVTEDLLGELG